MPKECLKNTYKLLNLRALEISTLYKLLSLTYGWNISYGIPKGTFEIPHKISFIHWKMDRWTFNIIEVIIIFFNICQTHHMSKVQVNHLSITPVNGCKTRDLDLHRRCTIQEFQQPVTTGIEGVEDHFSTVPCHHNKVHFFMNTYKTPHTSSIYVIKVQGVFCEFKDWFMLHVRHDRIAVFNIMKTDCVKTGLIDWKNSWTCLMRLQKSKNT